MPEFTEADLEDDGTIQATDDHDHHWLIKFAGERPVIEQIFAPDDTDTGIPAPQEGTDPPPLPEQDGETEGKQG